MKFTLSFETESEVGFSVTVGSEHLDLKMDKDVHNALGSPTSIFVTRW